MKRELFDLGTDVYEKAIKVVVVIFELEAELGTPSSVS